MLSRIYALTQHTLIKIAWSLTIVTASQHVPLYLYLIKRKKNQHLLFTLEGHVYLPVAGIPTFRPPYQHFLIS